MPLIAITSQTDNVFCTIVLEIEHILFLRIIECNAHIINIYATPTGCEPCNDPYRTVGSQTICNRDTCLMAEAGWPQRHSADT